jgi:hypothetical protein
VTQVGERGRHLFEGGRRRRLERARDVVELDGAHPAQHVGGGHLADPLGGGPQALAELVLDRACSAVNPSYPSLLAKRTTVAPLVAARRARSATVPKATHSGVVRTTSARRRSAGVEAPRAASMTLAIVTAAPEPLRNVHYTWRTTETGVTGGDGPAYSEPHRWPGVFPDGPTFDSTNPARPADVIGTLPASTGTAVDDAVAAAREAQRGWAAVRCRRGPK